MKPIRLVDSHCHFDLYSDYSTPLADAEENQVATIAVTTTPRAWRRNYELCRDTYYIRLAVGLHPHLAAERENECSLLERILPNTTFVGEIGIDGGKEHASSLDTQARVFERILKACAEHGDKILTVHSFRAASLVIDHIERCLPEPGRVVLHWFTGTVFEAKRAMDLGCFFSVNPRMLATQSGRNLVETIDPSKILTESDGPFIQIGTRPILPSDARTSVDLLSLIYKQPSDFVRRLILSNFKSLVSGYRQKLVAPLEMACDALAISP
jgi:TatD DNase family protein